MHSSKASGPKFIASEKSQDFSDEDDDLESDQSLNEAMEQSILAQLNRLEEYILAILQDIDSANHEMGLLKADLEHMMLIHKNAEEKKVQIITMEVNKLRSDFSLFIRREYEDSNNLKHLFKMVHEEKNGLIQLTESIQERTSVQEGVVGSKYKIKRKKQEEKLKSPEGSYNYLFNSFKK